MGITQSRTLVGHVFFNTIELYLFVSSFSFWHRNTWWNTTFRPPKLLRLLQNKDNFPAVPKNYILFKIKHKCTLNRPAVIILMVHCFIELMHRGTFFIDNIDRCHSLFINHIAKKGGEREKGMKRENIGGNAVPKWASLA